MVAGLDKMAGFDTVDHMTAVYRGRLLEKETSKNTSSEVIGKSGLKVSDP